MAWLDDFNRGTLRAGTALENPFAIGGEGAGQDFARGGGGGGGGCVILMGMLLLAYLAVLAAVPTILLSFFGAPVLSAMLRLRGYRIGFRTVLLATIKAMFVFCVLCVVEFHLLRMVPTLIGAGPVGQALGWMYMEANSRLGAGNGFEMLVGFGIAPPPLSARIQALALVAALPLLGMTIALGRLVDRSGFLAFLANLVSCAVTLAGACGLGWLTVSALSHYGTPLDVPLVGYGVVAVLFFGIVALIGGLVAGVMGAVHPRMRFGGMFLGVFFGLLIWGALCAVAYLYFRGADPVIALAQGMSPEGGLLYPVLAYVSLQVPALVVATGLVGAELEFRLQLALGACLALLGNGIALAFIRLLAHN